MMIHCLMIGKDRCIETVKVDAKKTNFTHNKGLYTIPKEAVNLTEYAGTKKVESYPELVYIEGVALPVNLEEGSVQEFLENVVDKNIMDQLAQARSNWFNLFADYIKHPSKIMILAFVAVIVAALIGGLLG